MFFILSKVLQWVLMPIVWIFCILIFSLVTKNKSQRKKGLILGIVLLFLFSNFFLADRAMSSWEEKPILISSLKKNQTAIVLTGVTAQRRTTDRVYFGKGADRLLHTVQLYKLGVVNKIFITGGSGLLSGDISESAELKKAFIYCGVPDSVITLEAESRNTHESAQNSKKIMDSLKLKGNFLLITSAFHMRRAKGCFDKAGILTTIYPVDYYSLGPQVAFTADQLLISSSNALDKWTLLIHEITGYLTYKILGYC